MTRPRGLLQEGSAQNAPILRNSLVECVCVADAQSSAGRPFLTGRVAIFFYREVAAPSARGGRLGTLWGRRFIAPLSLDRVLEAEAEVARARGISAELEPVVAQTPGQWWWALPDKGAGYVAALKTAGLKLE